ncbi:DUF3127 domain-containing protein [Proteiniphilum acetatigenes]|uniref:DUF3127 domain-containing protein n=1 Tax=Proteiniphilum acetatigenes TaxID=294710 RepID=UPI000361D319|nr:DUF3127 domain-containing protein [Proteiniphilum acetatigenes]SFL27610.1 protein of unknown function [Porphyromonadaceae bacterium KH3CP3RA]
MQLTAKLIQLLPLQSGTGRNGEWRKQDIIVETQDQYPKKVCISLWGNKFQHISLNSGELYTIDFDVESREFNGRWYTDVKAWRIEAQNVQNSTPAPSPKDEYEDIPPPENPFSGANEEIDDLPF